MNSARFELASLPSELAPLADRSFACIALAVASRAAQAPVARKLIQRQPSHTAADLDGSAFDLATFEPASTELPNLVCLVGDLKTAIVVVRGRLYPPGQHTRLYQWLTCHARMVAMRLPASACHYCTAGLVLPCSLLGSFHAHAAPPEPAAYYAAAASRDGLDRCPRFRG